MVKVLYIGHILENSGWGTVARNNILAMNSVDIDVYPQPFILGNATAEISPKLQELLNKPKQQCDICIQHVLPHHMVYDGRFRKNVGIFELDHNGIQNTSWVSHLNLMDELWVPHPLMCCFGIKKPFKLLPHTFDTSVYEKGYKPLQIKEIAGNFTFYTIGELHRRKHLPSLIRAFHTEFSTYEPVSLLIKAGKFNTLPQEVKAEIEKMCNIIKDGLRLYSDKRLYKKETIITDRLSDEDIYRLHNTCDCFVSPSYGEAWNIPAFEAMAFGRFPICTDCGGPREYIVNKKTGLLVNCHDEQIIGLDPSEIFEGIGTAREWWWNVNIGALQKAMRFVYENRKDTMENREYGLDRAKRYDYNIIGKKIKALLDD